MRKWCVLGAPQLEADIRAIYAAIPRADDFFRCIRCTCSERRLELRWSQAITGPYNDALVKIVAHTTRTVSFEPEQDPGAPTGVFPISVFVARPGPSVASLLSQEAAL